MRLHACVHLPADEAPTDGHLFTFIHHSGPWLAVHHSILVPSPGLASTLNPATHTLQSVALQCSAVCFCLCVHVCVCVFANVHALVYIVISVSKARWRVGVNVSECVILCVFRIVMIVYCDLLWRNTHTAVVKMHLKCIPGYGVKPISLLKATWQPGVTHAIC